MSIAALVGPRREAHVLVTAGEVDIEEGDQGLDVVVALAGQLERCRERKVLHGNGIHVDVFDEIAVGDYLVGVDDIYEGLREGYLADAAHVETVHVVPPFVNYKSVNWIRWALKRPRLWCNMLTVDFLVLVLPVLDSAYVEGCVIRHDETTRCLNK